MMRRLLQTLAALAAASCAAPRSLPPGVEAWSLDGRPLAPMEMPESRRASLEERAAEARAARNAAPDRVESWVWYGRRVAYTGRFREAVAIYTEGLRQFPDSAWLLRHRGHRYISLREFSLAIDDLERAAALTEGKPDEEEPPGDPGGRAESLQYAIHYHLGLAHYLRGENGAAAAPFRRALAVARDDDGRVGATHWLCCVLRRLGRREECAALLANVGPSMEVKESVGYLRLVLLYKGTIGVAEITIGEGAGGAAAAYGIGNWLRDTGEEAAGREVLGKILKGPERFAFGYLASEADFVRAGIPIPR